ncbi:hypothetical protein [Rhodococcus sp. MEB064]|uniref:hypothetical protein n=1 Tax=Rhodococcus sp. MEB064 TaxID=1587522 RepID=UPI0012E01DC3|nr:hypothetical protein [Rhodococcus sp. MEB064]
MNSGDLLIMSDSDVIWTGADAAERMWAELSKSGSASYVVGYEEMDKVNGLTRSGMSDLAVRIGLARCADVVYIGGEFVGIEWTKLGELISTSEDIVRRIFELHRSDTSVVCEEAHVLSLAFASMDFPIGNADSFVRRLWTQPLKWRNVCSDDLHLALWHLPAEKKYGINRLYVDYVKRRRGSQLVRSSSGAADRATLGRWVGVPRNTAWKVTRDCARAILARMKDRLSHG